MNWSSLFQTAVCLLCSAKPLPEPTMNFIKQENFHSWKISAKRHLQIAGNLAHVSMLFFDGFLGEPLYGRTVINIGEITDMHKRAHVMHWNGNVVILTNFSPLAALEVVKMTTSSAASGEIFVKMTTKWQLPVQPMMKISSKWRLTFPFQCGDGCRLPGARSARRMLHESYKQYRSVHCYCHKIKYVWNRSVGRQSVGFLLAGPPSSHADCVLYINP